MGVTCIMSHYHQHLHHKLSNCSCYCVHNGLCPWGPWGLPSELLEPVPIKAHLLPISPLFQRHPYIISITPHKYINFIFLPVLILGYRLFNLLIYSLMLLVWSMALRRIWTVQGGGVSKMFHQEKKVMNHDGQVFISHYGGHWKYHFHMIFGSICGEN